MKLRVIWGQDGQWYVRLLARNNKIMMHSEGYTRHRDAKRAASRIAAGLGLVHVADAARR